MRRGSDGERRKRPAGRAVAPLLAVLVVLAGGCAGVPVARPAGRAEFPAARFAVIADPHLFDMSTGSPGPAGDRGLDSGITLPAQSAEILQEALAGIAAEEPDFVLVCGDITRDGERSSHELAARAFARLREGRPGEPGPAVLVVPGNHDVDNPRAARLVGDAVQEGEPVSAAQFAAIYAGAGYAGALRRDPASLSYVAQPVPGLWVIAIDSCRYRENRGWPVAGGRVSGTTLAWVRGVLREARSRGAAVIAFLHHGLAEHFPGQAAVDRSRVASGAARLTRLLAEGGVRVVFTGHGHAQDAVQAGPGGAGLVDVQTGSLVMYPDPWRIATLRQDGTMRIESRSVVSIPSRPDGFALFARGRLEEGIRAVLARALGRAGVRLPDAERLAAQAAATAILFYAGDEQAGEVTLDTGSMCGWSAVVARTLEGPLTRVGNDTPPPDNGLEIDLAAPLPPPAAPFPSAAGDRR